MNRENLRSLAGLFKAMGHPSRLQMIQLLADDEMCVSDLQKVVGSDLSTVSKHLSVLKSVGIVADRKQGLQVFYRLAMPCVTSFIGCVDSAAAGNVCDAGLVSCCEASKTPCCERRTESQGVNE